MSDDNLQPDSDRTSFYPDSEDLYDRFLSELNYLKDQENLIARNKEEITGQYYELKDDNPDDWVLDINPNWVLTVGGPNTKHENKRDFTDFRGRIILGGRVEVKDSVIEQYSLNLTLLAKKGTEARGEEKENATIGAPCCWKNGGIDSDWRVARRYHFDIETKTEDDDPKPVSHLQVGGEFKSEYVNNLDPHYCSSPLDKPRIPYPPMDPVLILHMMATQYNSMREIIQGSWNNQVRKSEDCLWQKYHKVIHAKYQNGEDRESMAHLFQTK